MPATLLTPSCTPAPLLTCPSHPRARTPETAAPLHTLGTCSWPPRPCSRTATSWSLTRSPRGCYSSSARPPSPPQTPVISHGRSPSCSRAQGTQSTTQGLKRQGRRRRQPPCPRPRLCPHRASSRVLLVRMQARGWGRPAAARVAAVEAAAVAACQARMTLGSTTGSLPACWSSAVT